MCKLERRLVPTLLAAGLLLLATAPLAAQDVTVKLKGSKLSLTGGDTAVTFSISTGPLTDDGDGGGSSGDAVTVTPAKGTTLNGGPDVLSFADVKSLKIVLGPDADTLHFVDFTFGGPITLHNGSGADLIDFTNCILGGTLKLFGDGDDDTFLFGTSTITGKLTLTGSDGELTMNVNDCNFVNTTVSGGSDDDNVSWNNVAVKGSLRINLAQGTDIVNLSAVDIGLDTNVNLSAGDNSFASVGSSFDQQFKLTTGNGADTLSFEDSQIGQALKVTMGPGENSFSLNSVASAMQVGEQLVVKGGKNADTVTFAAGATPGLVIQVGEFAQVSLSGDTNQVTGTGFMQVGTDFKYSGGGGDDHVSLDGTEIGDNLSASLAAGTNDVTLNDCTGVDLKITAGSGDDAVALTGTTDFSGKHTIKLGGGDNIEP